MRTQSPGFALTELLVATLIMTVVMLAVVGGFSAQNRAHLQQEQSTALEQNLRIGVGLLAHELRRADYGVPANSLSTWIPWVSGFTTNPRVVQGTGSNPDTLSLARCTGTPVATLTANASQGSTSLTVSTTSALNTTNRRLIRIGDVENAHVQNISGSVLTIDTDPGQSSNQGLSRAFLTGTPLCRVDVLTFDVSTSTVPALRLNRNQGEGAETLVEGISDLQIAASGLRYTITLTGRSERTDPVSGTLLTRRLSSGVTLRN